MKFPYLVKHDGVYYPIGTDVPIETKIGEGVTAPAAIVSGKVEKEDIEEVTDDLPFIVPHKYQEEDLNVPFQTLKKMCKENGIKFTNKDGAEVLREKLRAL